MKCKQCKKTIKKGEKTQRVGLSTIHPKCLDAYIQFHIKKSAKDRQKKKKEMIKYKKEAKAKKSLVYTQEVFNKYIRLRDTTPTGRTECISCNNIIEFGTKTCHAGHYYSRGARSDLRFNEYNVHAQCMNCNNFGTAPTTAKYKENLIKKIGKKKYEELKIRKKQDYSEQNLKKIRKKYSNKIKLLKCQQKKYQ